MRTVSSSKTKRICTIPTGLPGTSEWITEVEFLSKKKVPSAKKISCLVENKGGRHKHKPKPEKKIINNSDVLIGFVSVPEKGDTKISVAVPFDNSSLHNLKQGGYQVQIRVPSNKSASIRAYLVSRAAPKEEIVPEKGSITFTAVVE